MAIITDATGRQLAQAVGGIDTGGLAKDTTLQATNTALGNMNSTQQGIATAITNLGQLLGNDKADIDGANIVNPSAFRNSIELNEVFKRVRFSATYNIKANAELTLTSTNFNFSAPSGYTTLALYSYTTGNTNVIVRNIYAECNMTIKNLSSNILSNITAQIDVIFVKSILM